MGSERALLWAICTVLMMFVVVSIIHYAVILHVKMEFDLCCQQVFWHCEQNEGLVSQERINLKATLMDKGFEDIVILAPISGSISKGQKASFSVTARKPLRRCMALFQIETRGQEFVYQQFIVGRRVIN